MSEGDSLCKPIKGVTLMGDLDLMLPMHNIAHMPRAAEAVWKKMRVEG